MPKQSGSATRKTTSPAGKSYLKFAKGDKFFLLIKQKGAGRL
jgi:hypothetical protein